MAKHASIRPDEMSEGGSFGFPSGAIVTITAASWVTWEDAGEKASAGREEDPALRLEGEVEGSDSEEPVIEHLGAGKATRLVPSDDNEFLDVAEGAPDNTTLNKNSNAGIFLHSLSDKKVLGKKALDTKAFDTGISTMVGLKFEVGKKVPEKQAEDAEFKRRPVTIAQDILEAPAGKKGKKSASKKVKDEDEGEEEEAPKSKAKGKKKGSDDDASEAAEKAVLEALDNPKYRKGLPKSRAFTAVHALVKDEDNAEAIGEQVNDEDWLTSDDRPWNYDSEEETLTKA